MKKLIKLIMNILLLTCISAAFAFAASSDMKGHDMTKSDKIGDLIHESVIDGYMLSYYFLDLRDQNGGKEMDKPHHIMLYIMDDNHKQVLKGKVGFMIKDVDDNKQKAMGMFMSKGFGTTADMKEKGVYKITTKAILGDKKLMDSFNYEIK
jgi:hypothetical protein